MFHALRNRLFNALPSWEAIEPWCVRVCLPHAIKNYKWEINGLLGLFRNKCCSSTSCLEGEQFVSVIWSNFTSKCVQINGQWMMRIDSWMHSGNFLTIRVITCSGIKAFEKLKEHVSAHINHFSSWIWIMWFLQRVLPRSYCKFNSKGIGELTKCMLWMQSNEWIPSGPIWTADASTWS